MEGLIDIPEDIDLFDDCPEPQIDDYVNCGACGAPISDAEHDDNHGLCDRCAP